MGMTLGTVLVIGGSGSFGTAFIRTLLEDNLADRVVSVSRNAAKRYDLEQAIPDRRLSVVPGDVRQPEDLWPLFEQHPDVVVVAAAEKHIGTGEKYRDYASATNVEGAWNVIEHCHDYGVKRTLALSTDKATQPIANHYGQTKADAEEAYIAGSEHGCMMSLIRYGNVVGSSGSVIPLFMKQRQNGRLTVTDRRMTRYWMPLDDPGRCDLYVLQEPGSQPAMSAVRWALLALEHMQGGEIFVPEIPSATVEDVARAIAPDAEIVEIGIRDGEKLHEDLIAPAESDRTWRVPFGGWAITPADYNGDARGWSKVLPGFQYRSNQCLQPVRLERA